MKDIDIKNNIALDQLTTMGVGGNAHHFSIVNHESNIEPLVDYANEKYIPVYILGGGSNTVFSDSGFSGIVIKMEISGIKCVKENETDILVSASAGESWDDFVAFTVKNGWWGLENMSFIPGTVGAVAVQNVGAYGQDCSRVIEYVRAYDTLNKQFVEISNSECDFGFRTSIFNTTAFNRYIITETYFKLRKQPAPILTRHNLTDKLKDKNKSSNIQNEIRETIKDLRYHSGLLPTPNSVGNSGTFFRATVVPHSAFITIIKKSIHNLSILQVLGIIGCRLKLSSKCGFLIPSKRLMEACKITECQYGGVSLFSSNCAVVINSLNTSCAYNILKTIKKVREIVYLNTGLAVSIEPTLVGFTKDELDFAFFLPTHDKQKLP